MSVITLLNHLRQQIDEESGRIDDDDFLDGLERSLRAAWESDNELRGGAYQYARSQIETAERSIAKLCRVERLRTAGFRHPKPWTFWRLRKTYDAIGIALIDPGRQRCPICDLADCEVWGTV